MNYKKLFFCLLVLLIAVQSVFSQSEEGYALPKIKFDTEKPEQSLDFIVHYKKWGLSSFNTYQFLSSETIIPNTELNKILTPIEGNSKLMKKHKGWKFMTYTMIASFIGTGIGCYCSKPDSVAEYVTGSLSLISLLSVSLTGNAAEAYRMQAIDNYNMYVSGLK